MRKLLNKLNLKREIRHYNKYLDLNRKRKGTVNIIPLFSILDELRRRTGFIK